MHRREVNFDDRAALDGECANLELREKERMEMETWRKLLGKSQDDPAVKAALAAAGVKKIPKLDEDDTEVSFNLKGHGLWLVMTDEAFLKDLDDQDIGEGPLILTGVGAYLDRPNSRDLYKGTLPYKIAADMTKAAVRKALGPPTSSDDESRFDLWSRDGLEVIARYTKDWKLEGLTLALPGS